MDALSAGNGHGAKLLQKPPPGAVPLDQRITGVPPVVEHTQVDAPLGGAVSQAPIRKRSRVSKAAAAAAAASSGGNGGDGTGAEGVTSPPNKKSRTNTPWTPQEEQRLKQMRDAGKSWSEIARTFPNRTEGSVKKHWYKVSFFLSSLVFLSLNFYYYYYYYYCSYHYYHRGESINISPFSHASIQYHFLSFSSMFIFILPSFLFPFSLFSSYFYQVHISQQGWMLTQLDTGHALCRVRRRRGMLILARFQKVLVTFLAHIPRIHGRSSTHYIDVRLQLPAFHFQGKFMCMCSYCCNMLPNM